VARHRAVDRRHGSPPRAWLAGRDAIVLGHSLGGVLVQLVAERIACAPG